MRRKILKTTPRKTALWEVTENGYTLEGIWRSYLLFSGIPHVIAPITKEQADEILTFNNVTMFELTLAQGLINAYEAGNEQKFRQHCFKWGRYWQGIDLQRKAVNNNN